MVAATLGWLLLLGAMEMPSSATEDSAPTAGPTSSPLVAETQSAVLDLGSAHENSLTPSPPPQPPFKKLSPTARVRAILGLVLILFLGVLLLLSVWLGARVTRRFIQREEESQTRIKRHSLDEDDWARKPLVPRDPFSKP